MKRNIYGPWTNSAMATPQKTAIPGGAFFPFDRALASIMQGATGFRGGRPLAALYAQSTAPAQAPRSLGVKGLTRGDTWSALRPLADDGAMEPGGMR